MTELKKRHRGYIRSLPENQQRALAQDMPQMWQWLALPTFDPEPEVPFQRRGCRHKRATVVYDGQHPVEQCDACGMALVTRPMPQVDDPLSLPSLDIPRYRKARRKILSRERRQQPALVQVLLGVRS